MVIVYSFFFFAPIFSFSPQIELPDGIPGEERLRLADFLKLASRPALTVTNQPEPNDVSYLYAKLGWHTVVARWDQAQIAEANGPATEEEEVLLKVLDAHIQSENQVLKENTIHRLVKLVFFFFFISVSFTFQ